MNQFQSPQPMQPAGFAVPREPKGGGGKKLALFGCLGCLGVSVLAVVAIVGVLMWFGTRPTLSVQSEATLPVADLQALRDNGLLDDGESLQLIYTQGIADFSENTFYFTDRRVVFYGLVTAPVTHEIATYDRVVDIELFGTDQPFFEDSTIVVTLADGGEIIGLVTAIEDADRRFYNKLRSAWLAANPAAGPDGVTDSNVDEASDLNDVQDGG